MGNKAQKNVRRWRKTDIKRGINAAFSWLLCLAMLVSSMSMALPVYAQEAPCTQEEHTHGEGCYVQVTSETVTSMVCSIEADVIVHQHTDFCYDDAGNLRCTLEEKEAHTHGEDCLDEEGSLICQKEELELHTHEAGCYDEEGALVCESVQVVEHVHTEECFATEEVPVDTETLTCTVTDETHEHTALCHGIWVLDCDQPEHAHTETCLPEETTPETTVETTETTEATTETTGVTVPEGLTEEEQAQVDAVIAQIDALPTADEIDTQAAAFENDEEEEAYLTEVHTQVATAYKAYTQLGETLRGHVTNWDKLAELEYIWSAFTLEEPVAKDSGNTQYGEALDGDYAYIDNLSVSCQDGDYPLDSDDAPGNDSSLDNGILRTYDTATYTISFQTHLCEKLDDNFGGYAKGRLHYEFILPFSESEARFETDSMGWMKAFPEGVYTLTTEPVTTETGDTKTIQVLRGSFMLKGETEEDKDAIGEGERTLKVVIRALTLSNDMILQPYYTLWLEYNKDNDGKEITYVKDTGYPIHTGLITDLSSVGATETTGEETHFHKPQTCVGEEITITAAPRYNIALETSSASANSSRGTYNFSEGNENAPNYGAGEIDGRLYGFGITIELWGEEKAKDKEGNDVSKGLLGVELPTGDIELTIALETWVNRYDGKGYVEVTDTYRPMVWSGGENEEYPLAEKKNPDHQAEGRSRDPDWYTEREVDTDLKDVYAVPINWRLESDQDTWHRGHCYDGGNWSVGVDDTAEDGDAVNLNEVHVTVSGYQINFKQMPVSYQRGQNNTYYNPDAVGDDFWKINHAVFSAGELWVVMPYTYTATDGEAVDLRDTCNEGTTMLRAWIREGSVDGHSFQNPHYNNSDFMNREPAASNMNLEDDRAVYTDPFAKSGDIVTRVYYLRPGAAGSEAPLTQNCQNNQNDWAMAGQKGTLLVEYYQDNKEDGYRIAGMDLLIKFDDAFFEPTGYRYLSNKPFDDPILWAAKADKTGWDHKGLNPYADGYDEEQQMTTPEDLIYFDSLDALKEAGYTCVGALMQRRRIIGEGNNYYHLLLDGVVKSDAPLGYTYLLTYDCRSWSLADLHEYVQTKETLPSEMTPSNKDYDEQYNAYAAKYLPQWDIQTAEAVAEEGYRMISYEDYFETCFIRTWEKTTTTAGEEEAKSAFQNSKKTIYENGFPVPGNGAPHYIDTCLVVPYTTQISKTTAQTNADGSSKTKYELGLNQVYVDYKLTPTASRVMGSSDSTGGAEKVITVEIIDILPLGMTLYDGKIYWTGQGENSEFEYEQAEMWQAAGTVTGGIAPATEGSDTEPWFEVKIETLKKAPYEGRERIWITLHNVTLSGNENTSLGEIYYTCKIQSDMPDGTRLENVTRIRSVDDMREQTVENGNMASYSIEVLRNTAMSLSKVPAETYVEWYDPIEFTMNIGNNSGNDMQNVILADSLPVNGVDGSDFTGPLVLTEFSAVMSKGDSELNLDENLSFYYTTSEDFIGYKEAENLRVGTLTVNDLTKEGSVWTKLDPVDASSTTWTFRLPDAEDQGEQQITAIVACGDIPAGYNLKLCSTIKLPEGQANDYLVNYLSMNNGLYTNAYVRVVSRTISGKTWHEDAVDHLYSDGDELLDGVQIALLQKNDEGEYVPFCYQDSLDQENPVPVVIQSGQKVSVQKNGSVEVYEPGQYLFADLPAGDFAVRFSSGSKSIYTFTACDQNAGDDTKDSDGVPTYEGTSGNGLMFTEITGIIMPAANSDEMVSTFGKYSSKNNDSGFYSIQYELPLTGGMGTTIYYILGAVLTLPALAGLRRRRKR